MYLQKVAAGGFNALTIYILICMIFVAMAMMYYGLILLKLRLNVMKIGDTDSGQEGNKELTISIIKLDISMLIVYVIIFIIFNVFYFSIYS